MISSHLKKKGYLSFIGAPNSGKSTLFNSIIGKRISSVTHKIHTTRDNIRGIYTKNNTQLVFIDTPGYIKNPKRKLERSITKKSLQEIKYVDFVCIIIDISKKNCMRDILLDKSYYNNTKQLIVILNKIDLLEDKTMLLEYAKQVYDKGFSKIFMISAKNKKGIKDFLNFLLDSSPYGIWDYDKNTIIDRDTRKITEDATMEQLYKLLNKEIPYSLKVEVESWKEQNNSITIHHVITVLKESQKKIILGPNGSHIRKICMRSKAKIINLLNKKVHLYLFVKVREKWIDNALTE